MVVNRPDEAYTDVQRAMATPARIGRAVARNLRRATAAPIGDDLTHISFSPARQCGLAHCDHLTTSGLLEQDPQTPGLWRLLPICSTCSHDLSAPRYS